MAIKKTPVKAVPTVTVETKKISSEKDVCCAGGKCPMHHVIKIGFAVLLVLNTILLIALLANQDQAEALKVGGPENYKLLKQIFVSDGYKAQQKQQIEQALQMFANPTAQQGTTTTGQQAPAQVQQAPAAQ